MSVFYYIHYNDVGEIVLGEDEVMHLSFDAADAMCHFSQKSTQTYDTSDFWGKYEYTLEDDGMAVLDSDETTFTNGSSWREDHPENSGANNNGPDVSYHVSYNSLIIGNDNDNIIYGADTATHWGGLDDTVYGGLGGDTIYGLSGDDALFGEDGDDVLFGGKGADLLVGGDGDDLIYSGRLYDGSSDELIGGAGHDTFVLGDFTGDTVPNAIDWNALAIQVSEDLAHIGYSATPNPAVAIAKGVVPAVYDIANAVIDAQGSETFDAPEAAYAAVEDFNPVEDVLILPLNASGLGNVFISSDTDTQNAFTIKYDTGTSVDIVATVTFADASEIYGDGVTSMSASAQQAFVDAIMQSAMVVGSDGVTYGLADGYEVDAGDVDLGALGTNSYIVMGAYSGAYLQGDSAADYLFGTDYGDVISGYRLDATAGTSFAPEDAGNDEMRGFGGDDMFYGGAGNDYIYGGEGDDTSLYIDAEAGISVDLAATESDANGTYAQASDGFGTTDKLYSVENIVGSAFDDTIDGDEGANVLSGGEGDNRIAGDGGDDTIYAGSGDDTIDGGGGDDMVVVGGGENVIDGGAGTDLLDFTEADGAISFDAVAGTLTGADGLVSEVSGIEDVTGSQSTDRIVGGDSGGWLTGLGGDDVIIGGAGADTLTSGEGADTLTGGAGADTFVLDGSGVVTITDFDASEDVIMVDGSAHGLDITGTPSLLDFLFYQDDDYDVHFVEYGKSLEEIFVVDGIFDHHVTTGVEAASAMDGIWFY